MNVMISCRITDNVALLLLLFIIAVKIKKETKQVLLFLCSVEHFTFAIR